MDSDASVGIRQGTMDCNVSPARLAESTVAHAFEEATLTADGNVSFDEFRRWYSRYGRTIMGLEMGA